MGATQSKVRSPPARYVAKQLPRAPKDIEEEFKKAKHTMKGINKLTERVSTTPQPSVEKRFEEGATENPDTAAPRWYLNSWMELMDNRRQDRLIITGNLPASWERDRFEPYSLVKNRIDDEDLDWLLSAGKDLPMDDLIGQTKLEREPLEDILATVELPRRQYRNYQGKLHKAIDDPNTFLADRKARLEENREDELLKQIGYSDKEVSDDRQYRTERSRGVKTLDALGVSVRANRRLERAALHDDMQQLLEKRKIDELESGTYEPTEEDLARPDEVGVPRGQMYKARSKYEKDMYKLDMKHDHMNDKLYKIAWWGDRRRAIPGPRDHRPDAPQYNSKVSSAEDELDKSMDRSALMTQHMAMAAGAKGFFDPRSQYQEMLDLMRAQKDGDVSKSKPKDMTASEFAKEQEADAAQKLKEWDASNHPQARWIRERHGHLAPKLGAEAAPPAEGTADFDPEAARAAKGLAMKAAEEAAPASGKKPPTDPSPKE
eukprot:CAMPEP_0174851700 /NCGR_PEP_ID=MMETSP1114-20130205/23425_1 /TAXON_ID=312471 /ORGANISM="Neobodo designis, Strain CCAP 1951/1" /LENGTH=488 /DNA_ID=CAMNT_0016086251 /DNA_START=59 /DNA_END=1525 /DNA_ORIENTATION=+